MDYHESVSLSEVLSRYHHIITFSCPSQHIFCIFFSTVLFISSSPPFNLFNLHNSSVRQSSNHLQSKQNPSFEASLISNSFSFKYSPRSNSFASALYRSFPKTHLRYSYGFISSSLAVSITEYKIADDSTPRLYCKTASFSPNYK